MRPLTESEVDLIAGGYGTGGWSSGTGGWSSTFTGGTITVTGNPGGSTITVTGNPSPPGSPFPSSPFPSPSDPGGDPGTPPPEPPADSDSHDVTVNIARPLSPQEAADLQAYKDSIARDDAYVKAIPDNAQLTLDNGQVITGAELKEAWANTDFVVNDIGTSYANNSGRGEANWNNGDPVVSMNIDNITAYNQSPGGSDYLPLHEVAHLTSDQRSDYGALQGGEGGYTAAEAAAFEARASDIARAVAEYNGGATLADDGGRYSAGHPTFQVPAG